MASPVFFGLGRIVPERAEAAMCKAISIKSIQKLYTWLPRTSAYIETTRFPLASLWQLADVLAAFLNSFHPFLPVPLRAT